MRPIAYRSGKILYHSEHRFSISEKKSHPCPFNSWVLHFFQHNFMILERNLMMDFSELGREWQNCQKWWSGNGKESFQFVQQKFSFPIPLNEKISVKDFNIFPSISVLLPFTISYLCYYTVYPARCPFSKSTNVCKQQLVVLLAFSMIFSTKTFISRSFVFNFKPVKHFLVCNL